MYGFPKPGLPPAPPHPGYVPGLMYPTWGAQITTLTAMAAVDTIYFYWWFNPWPFPFTAAKAYTQTAGAGSSVKFGIWAASPRTKKPQSLLFADNTGVTTQASTTTITPLLGPGIVPAGPLWVGAKFTGTLPIMLNTGTASASAFFAGGLSTAGPNQCTMTYADAYANDLPNIAEGAVFAHVQQVVPVLSLIAA